MCWSAPISFLAFFLGTAFNIWLITQIPCPTIYALAFCWQWIILMQLYEGLHWSGDRKFSGMAANITSILQPLVLIFALIIVNSNPSLSSKSLAGLVGLMYILFILIKMTNKGISTDLSPRENCTHLNISWPTQLNNTQWAYLITLLLGFFLLLRPFNFGLIIAGYIFLALMISIFFYSCGSPSMWCFFSVAAPLVTYFAWKYTH